MSLTMTAYGTLYIVSTPIGNLEDITLRALKVLKEADIIAAEDTRVTRKLLSHYDIHVPMTAYHQHSQGKRANEILDHLKNGKNVALVSDAGTPGISDPGHELIALCIQDGVPLVAIPGPSAIITAVVISGLSTTHFAFDGFPPRKDKDRRAFFDSIKHDTRTIILYESPLRLLATLRSALARLGDRRISITREATKLFEETYRGTISGAIAKFEAAKPKGEFTVVIEGAEPEDVPLAGEQGIEERLRSLIESGVPEKDAIRQTAIEFKVPKREAYAAALRLKEEG